MTLDEARPWVREWLAVKTRNGRFSRLLVEQLAEHLVERTAPVHSIFDELGDLEAPNEKHGGTKQATQFKYPPLKGLWHQHYFEPRFLARNLISDLRSKEAQRTLVVMCDAMNRGLDASRYVHKLVIDGYQRHHAAGQMTGQWIVFAKIDQVNYYLTLANHREDANRREGDLRIFERIKACFDEFPEVGSIWR